MTRYWVVRTNKAKTEEVASELARGQLRQGWGWDDEQDLQDRGWTSAEMEDKVCIAISWFSPSGT
jgi:hypothetical protein